MEDLLGPRAWSDHESCRGFASELLSAFPSCFGLSASALQQLGWAGKAGRSAVWGGAAGGDTGMGTGQPGGGETRICRYAEVEAQRRVHRTFMKCLAKFVNNVAARDNARLLLRVLAMACSVPAGRLVVAQQLEGLINSTAHSRAAQTVLELLVTHMGEGGAGVDTEDDGKGEGEEEDRTDEDVVSVLFQLRLRPQHAGIIPQVASNLVSRHPQFTPLVVQMVSIQDIRDHTPHAMKCLSAAMEVAPGDWVAQAVAQALQALSRNGETKPHLRPFMRRMMKACSTVYRDWPDVWRYLMQPPEEAAGWSEVVREQWLLEVIQMVTFLQLLLVGGVSSPSADGASEIPGDWALETVAQFAAEAAEWCQAILCDLLPDISSENLLLALRRLLFLEGRQAYFTSGEGVPEHESEAFNRLATGLPTSEDTLTRVVLMGLTDTPLSGEDALDLAEALLCRSAAAWATQPQSGRTVSRVSNPEVLNALTRLAEYSPPAPPLSGIEPEEPIEPLARAPLYWKVSLVLVLVCALNFEDFGSVMLDELPVVSALMEALATSRPCYPRAYGLQTEGLSVDPELQHAAGDREASLRLQKYLNKCGSLWCPPEGLMRLNFTLVRAAPSEVLDKLMVMDRQYSLGKHIRSLSNPDILLNILKAMQQEEAWDWLVPILENEPAASAKLPPEWSGTLLMELFDRLHSCEEARKNPATTITLIEHTSKRLRNVLETVDCVDCSLLMSLKPIVDALLGESARHRDLAHSSLNSILSASGSISTVPDDGVEAATQCNRLAWLERLVQRASPGHGYTLTTVLPSIVSSMVFFESDPKILDEYLRLLDSEMRGATSPDAPDGSFPLVVATFLLCRPLTVELLFQERPGTVPIILAAILKGLDSEIRVDLTSKELSTVTSLYSQWFPRAPQPGARANVSGFGPEFECLHLNLAAAVKAIQVLGQVVNSSAPEEVVTKTKHLTDRVFAEFVGPQPPNGPQRTLSVGGGPPENLFSADDLEQLARGHNVKLCQLAMSLMPRGDVVKFVRRYADMSKVSITCLLEKLDEMSDADILHTAVAESGLLGKEFLEALAALRRCCMDEQPLQEEVGAGYRAELAVKRSPRSSESPQGRLIKRNAGVMEVDAGTALAEGDTLVSMSHLGAFVDSLFVPASDTFSEPVLAVELELHSQALAMQMLRAGRDSSPSNPEAASLRFVTSVASALKERSMKCSKTSLGARDSLFADSPRLASVLQALTSCDPALPAKSKAELRQLCLFVSKQSGGDTRIAAARVAQAFVDDGLSSVAQSSLLEGVSPNISAEALAEEFVRADLQLLKDLHLGGLHTSRVPKTVILEALLLSAMNENVRLGSDADDATLSELRVSTLFECLEKADPGMEFCLDGFSSCLQTALPSPGAIRSCRVPPPSSTLECIVKSLASPLRVLMHEASWARREIVVETILKKCSDFDLERLVAATTDEIEVRCAAAAAGIILDTVSCFVRHPATWASWQERGSHPRKSILSQYYKFGLGASSCITKLILFESFHTEVSQLRRFPLLLTLFFAEEGVARCAAEVLSATATAKVDAQGSLVNASTALLDRLYAVAPVKTSRLVSRGEEFVRVDLQSSEVDAVFHRLVRKVCLSTGPDCVAAVESCCALGRILPFHFSKHLPALAAFLSPLSEAVSVASDEDMAQICDMFSLIFDLLQALGGRLWTTPSDSAGHCVLSCMEVIQSLMGVMLSAERNTSEYLSPLCERFCDYVREQSANSEAFRGAAAAAILPKLGDLQQAHPNVVGLVSLENYLAGAGTEIAATPATETGDIIAAICSFAATVSLRTASIEVEENDGFLTADSLADTGDLNVSCLDCISSLDDILSSDPQVIQNPELQQALLRFTQSSDEDLWREASYRLILRFLTNNMATSARNHSFVVPCQDFQDKMLKNVLDSLAGSFGLSVRTTALAFLPGMCRLSTERTPELISWALLFAGEQSLGSLLAVSQ